MERLCLIELAAWLAFEWATERSAPVCPSLPLAFRLAECLRQKAILRICLAPLPSGDPQGARAIYDPICWEYLCAMPPPGVRKSAIHTRLLAIARRGSEEARLRLWQELADAEFEAYFSHLLRRHNFEPRWAGHFAETLRHELRELTLAQKRQAAWASVREGAAAFLRTGKDVSARESVGRELRRRARWLLRQEGHIPSHVPSTTWRQPLLLQLFLQEIAPIGQSYWTEIPNIATLSACGTVLSR